MPNRTVAHSVYGRHANGKNNLHYFWAGMHFRVHESKKESTGATFPPLFILINQVSVTAAYCRIWLSEVSFNLNLWCQSKWFLFNGTWRKRREELDNQLSFEVGEMKQAEPRNLSLYWSYEIWVSRCNFYNPTTVTLRAIFISFFPGWRIPNLITGLNRCWGNN